MGKIISARLATDDYDPMNLLGTTDVFSPTKHRTKKINKKNKNSKKSNCKTKLNNIQFKANRLMVQDLLVLDYEKTIFNDPGSQFVVEWEWLCNDC